MAKHKFNKYQSIIDDTLILYGLTEGGVQLTIEGAKFIEVTPDFKRVLRVRADSFRIIGHTEREF